MDFEGGFADLVLLTFLLGVAQALASVVVEAYRKSNEHPLDEALRAIAFIMQEEMPKIRESLELMAITPEDDDE